MIHLDEKFASDNRAWVEIQAKHFNSLFFQFMWRHGKTYSMLQPIPQEEVREAKQCFRNALLLMLNSGNEYTYVEGYAANIVPVYHAWCVDAQGHVIDPTWNDRGKAYFGVPFNNRYVVRLVDKQDHYGVLEGNEALLTGKARGWRVR